MNNNLHTNFFLIRMYKFIWVLNAKARIGSNVCVLEIYIQDVPKAFLHISFVIREANEHAIPFRSYIYAYTVFMRFAACFFFLIATFETFCILYRSLFHFPLRLSPKILNIYWNDLAIMYRPGSLLGFLHDCRTWRKVGLYPRTREVKR